MKLYFIPIAILFSLNSFCQTADEKELLNLSSKIFEWEVHDKIGSLQDVFHSAFIVVSADGSSQRKNDYLQRLKSGDFVHNSIDIEEYTVIISGNTAVVAGKGKFTVTISGNKISLRLSYVEVFTREGSKKAWKVLAMKASVLDK